MSTQPKSLRLSISARNRLSTVGYASDYKRDEIGIILAKSIGSKSGLKILTAQLVFQNPKITDLADFNRAI
jgi:hypothetical protein